MKVVKAGNAAKADMPLLTLLLENGNSVMSDFQNTYIRVRHFLNMPYAVGKYYFREQGMRHSKITNKSVYYKMRIYQYLYRS